MFDSNLAFDADIDALYKNSTTYNHIISKDKSQAEDAERRATHLHQMRKEEWHVQIRGSPKNNNKFNKIRRDLRKDTSHVVVSKFFSSKANVIYILKKIKAFDQFYPLFSRKHKVST